MHGSILEKLVASALWLSQWGPPFVNADGFIAFPPEQHVKADSQVASSRMSDAGGLRGAQNTIRSNAFSNDSVNGESSKISTTSKKRNAKDSASSSSSSSSLKRLIDESIPDCGKSRTDVAPVDVTSADKFQWRSANAGYNKPSKGPCEIWIDTKRVFESQDCAKVFPEELGTIKFDYSPCRGECLLTFYWLETGDGNESKPTKHCVPIRNRKHSESDSSNKSESESKSASAPGSGSSSSGSASGSGSGSGSGMVNTKHLVVVDNLRDLGTLSEFYDAVYGSGQRRGSAARKPLARHHKLVEPLTPKWRQGPLEAASEPYFGANGYSKEYTKSTTQQCKYASNGDFKCSSTERITESVQPYGGDGLSDIAYQATYSQ